MADALDPTYEQSRAVARLFFSLAEYVAEHPDDVTHRDAKLRDYYGPDPETRAVRLWLLVAWGPIMVGNAVRQLHGRHANDVAMWTTDTHDTDIHERAAIQAVLAHINGDPDASHDVMIAHANVTGPEGLEEMLMHLIAMLASAMRKQSGKN
ncbi:hypothetical protein AB0425_17695 [Actinosynnema sp. NPDC051121]